MNNFNSQFVHWIMKTSVFQAQAIVKLLMSHQDIIIQNEGENANYTAAIIACNLLHQLLDSIANRLDELDMLHFDEKGGTA